MAFVLAACGPLLRRARPVNRWVMTVALIGWFVVLTRAEPSVLRAATMAGLSATAFLLGRQREPLRLLALAVIGLLLVDPLLAWSVGFWLSVGATAGVTGIGPWLAPRLAGTLGPVAVPAAITLGAQAGVALPSLLVFGRLSVIGTVANLVAVPVAGFVMLYGLPACLLAGAVPAVAPVVMVPVGAAVGWIDAVATVAARLEPPAPWSWLGWIRARRSDRRDGASTPSPAARMAARWRCTSSPVTTKRCCARRSPTWSTSWWGTGTGRSPSTSSTARSTSSAPSSTPPARRRS